MVAAAVERPDRHHMLLSGGYDGEQHRAQGGHAGSEGDGSSVASSDGDALFKAGHRRIPKTLVDRALPVQVRSAGGYLFVGESARRARRAAAPWWRGRSGRRGRPSSVRPVRPAWTASES